MNLWKKGSGGYQLISIKKAEQGHVKRKRQRQERISDLALALKSLMEPNNEIKH
jgi:hypothetical protein